MAEFEIFSDIDVRLRRLEDEREIRRLMDLVWLLSDVGPAEMLSDLYTEDCIIDLGRLLSPDANIVIEGIEAVRARYSSPAATLGAGVTHHCSSRPEALCIIGDEARVATYALSSGLVDGASRLNVTGFNFWRFARVDGRWRIARRIARRLGDADVRDLFKPIVKQVAEELC
jgi:hypothetical protein